jgi:cysteine desulfuration protein SufE
MTWKNREDHIKQLFNALNKEQRYEKLIELGRSLPVYPEELQTPDRIVPGCQSIVFLEAQLDHEVLRYRIGAEALISAGLAALLLLLYDGLPAEEVLKNPPLVIEEIGIHASLTPGRLNGLAGLYLKMRQEALRLLSTTSQLNFNQERQTCTQS